MDLIIYVLFYSSIKNFDSQYFTQNKNTKRWAITKPTMVLQMYNCAKIS